MIQSLKDICTSSENIPPEDKGLIFGSTKTGVTRSVGIPMFLADMLADQMEGGPDSLVFTSLQGGPLRHGNFYRRHFKPAVRAALPAEKHRLRFHDLRHTCAALLIAADAHPKAIQEHLGHRDIQTTFNVYGHLLPSAQEALAAALDSAYAGRTAGRALPSCSRRESLPRQEKGRIMGQSKGRPSQADNVRDGRKGITSGPSTTSRKHRVEEGDMTKSGTQAPVQGQPTPLSESEDQALQLLRKFSRDSRQTVKKPIRPQFGNRYVTPGSD